VGRVAWAANGTTGDEDGDQVLTRSAVSAKEESWSR
jgi:hypothetical protein